MPKSPLCLGPLSFGGGSFRVMCVRGERRCSLITHISMVTSMGAWSGLMGWGSRGVRSGYRNLRVVFCFGYNALIIGWLLLSPHWLGPKCI